MRSAAVLALGLAVSATTLAGQQLVATERAEVVATIWAEARYNFAFWDRVRADWDSALSANLRLAAQPQSDVLFYRRLRRLVALLGDGQAAVVPPANLRSRIARPQVGGGDHGGLPVAQQGDEAAQPAVEQDVRLGLRREPQVRAEGGIPVGPHAIPEGKIVARLGPDRRDDLRALRRHQLLAGKRCGGHGEAQSEDSC